MDEQKELISIEVDDTPGQPVKREEILALESALRTLPETKLGDQENCPLKHSFADGVYVREIFIPKGMLIVGKIHKHSHPNFLLKGDVSVVTEEGYKRIKGPCAMISPAGTKRVVYTHEDTVWITVHVTKETELDRIEEEIIAKNFDELPNNYMEILKVEGGVQCHGSPQPQQLAEG